ncbi:radical SAM family heme chaperone HemW [Leptolyngbya iicbica]|uniref:Heme chaperone HemW n=2 Tax=Cyanophyceae TaxID=3028117 RepID=A0A4Q7E1Z5_9CYAN|nr:radical SAM family heme chaperone HemW [Leptolyngbya sp. LK]RZM75236.1 coproporphyrinogen III oxidase [Leptolyngbya sp. LK]
MSSNSTVQNSPAVVASHPGLAAPQAAYVHIPFCRRRCFYCDFPIAVAGDRARGETSPRIQSYVDTLCQEIQVTPALGAPLKTVFFGGGTPSLLAVAQVEQILQALSDRFGIKPNAEISMEMDPGTFDRVALTALRQLGVNRVSLGVQSFTDTQLEACGRTHRLADVQQAIAALHAAAIPGWSLDLISGLPHQTVETWKIALETAIAYNPQHLSIYDLTVEPNTVFHRRYTAGADPLPTDDQTAEMYRLAQSLLTAAGYDHYEVSNYAKPGYQCQHNRVYWENRPFYGFGMGAASYTQGQRFQRPRTTHDYADWLQTYAAAGGQLDLESVTTGDRWLDRLMMGLRLAEGISLKDLVEEFGEERVTQLQKCLRPYRRQGWVADEEERATVVRFTDPEGFLFSNVVLVKLFETFDAT